MLQTQKMYDQQWEFNDGISFLVIKKFTKEGAIMKINQKQTDRLLYCHHERKVIN
jgi:hypothetical protein